MNGVRGPLRGLRVLEAGSWLAGPFAGSLLADFGAEVIKVEQPGTGDPLRAANKNHQLPGPDWSIEGRNKKSITLNLRTSEGQRLFRELAALSDVLIENFRPGRLEKWRVGPGELHQSNPGLVIVRVSGFGQDGPYRDRPAYDHVALAMSGLAHISGQPDGPPTKPGIVLADYMSGIFAALSALMGIYKKHNTGDGDVVDVAMYEVLFRLLEGSILAYHESGLVRGRTGNAHVSVYPADYFECADGKWVAINAGREPFFSRLCNVMDRPGLVEDRRFMDVNGRINNRHALKEILTVWMAERSSNNVLASLEEADVPASLVYDVEAICVDPHISARRSITVVKDDNGNPLHMQAVVPRFLRTPGQIRYSGPPLGKHNAEIFCGLLGYEREYLEVWQQQRII